MAALAALGLLRRSQGLASPLPFSDEAAHVNKALDLRDALARAPSTVEWAHALLFSSDAYPNLPPITAGPFLDEGLDGLRASMLGYLVLLGGVGAVAGGRVWGRAGGWAFAALVTLAPVISAFSRLYYVDVHLFALVGAGLVLTLASDGLRRLGPTTLLALVAAAGMLTKWVWAVFLVVPIGVALLRAVYHSVTTDGPGGWARRVGLLVGLGALVGGLAAVILWMGSSPFVVQYGARGHLAWVPVAVVGAGVAVWMGWVGVGSVRARRGRPLTPGVNAVALVVTTALLAGPWYVLVHSALWDRYRHERSAWLERGGVAEWAASVEATRLLLPAAEVLVPLGIVVAAATRRGGWTVLSCAGGVAMVFAVIVPTLPYDPRYLLPLLPLLAGSVVAGWSGLARGGAWVGLVAVFGLLAALWFGPAPTAATLPGLALVPDRWAGISLARATRVPSPDASPAEVQALLDEMTARCGGPRCGARFLGTPDTPLQGRGLTALSRLAGLPIRVEEGPGETADFVTVSAACRGAPRRLGEAAADAPPCVTLPLGTRGCRVEVCGASSGQGPTPGAAAPPPPPPR